MEDDRAQVDLGHAADIEESQLAQAQQSVEDEHVQNGEAAMKQPKKRFVGRRAAAEAAAARSGTPGEAGEAGAVGGMPDTH